MTLVYKTVILITGLEILGMVLLLICNTLPDFKWYRRFRGGLWYLRSYTDVDGHVMTWWTKRQPVIEEIQLVEIY